MPEKEYRIQFPHGVEESVLASVEGPGLYRLLIQPIACCVANFDDVIRVKRTWRGKLKFSGVEVQSRLSHLDCTMPAGWFERPDVIEMLSKVVENDGFWQRAMEGCLWISFDPAKYDPTEDLTAIRQKLARPTVQG